MAVASSAPTYSNPGLYLCGRPKENGSAPAQLHHNGSWIHLAPISREALDQLIQEHGATVQDTANNEYRLAGRAIFYGPGANHTLVPLPADQCNTVDTLNATLCQLWISGEPAKTLAPPQPAPTPKPVVPPRQIPYRLIFGGLFAASIAAGSTLIYTNKAQVHLWLNETIAIDAKLTSIGEVWTDWTTRLRTELSQLPSWSELFSKAAANTDSTLPLGAD